MRLTVRTLLAWLDRVLPPEEQDQLAAKVEASVPARQLVDRIRQVVERPTIPSPRVEGRGLGADANSVAEYLDNCLESERLEAFERICIESDMHLAEVAACHEMLAALARDPGVATPLDATGRRRLLEAMGHHSTTVFADLERREAASNARAIRSAIEAVPGKPGPHREPARRRASRAAWAAALTAVALLVALGAFLIDAVGRSRGRRADSAAAPAVAVDAARPPAAVEPAAPPAGPGAPAQPDDAVREELLVPEPQPAIGAVAPEAAGPQPDAVAADASREPMPPAAGREEGPLEPAPAAPAVPPRVPNGDALAIAAPTQAAPVAAPGAADIAASPPVAEAPQPTQPGGIETAGPVLRRTVEQGRSVWTASVRGTGLGPREDLIVPVGCQCDVRAGGITIRLQAATRAIVTADAGSVPRLELVFGRALVRAGRADAELGVIAGGLEGTISAGLDGQAAIAVDLDRAAGSDPAIDAPRVRATVVAVDGGLVWRQTGRGPDGDLRPLAGLAAEGMLDARTAIVWESAAAGGGRAERLDPLPAWITAPAPADKLERNAAEALAARLPAAASLDEAIHDLAADRRVENRILAASTLALIGDFDTAVDLLCTEAAGRRLEQRQWAKLEADVVPLALARGANAAAKLQAAFEARGPHGKADALFAMARGCSDADLAAGAADTLVAALEDGDLVVRRYAFKCLCDIVQPTAVDRLRYRPDGLPELRREGAAWWRGQLQKGLIRRPGAA